LALSDLQDGCVKSIRAAAKLCAIPRSTLQARVDGRISRVDIQPNLRKLTQLEEKSLVQWTISMGDLGAASRKANVRGMANILLAARGSYCNKSDGFTLHLTSTHHTFG
jgi:hypothetical protein